MSRPVVNPGTLTWSGEHWINYLRRQGDSADSGMLSLYHTRYSPAGEGTVAFVSVPAAGLDLVCSDDEEVAEFIMAQMIRGKAGPWDRPMPRHAATFRRSGDIRREPGWVVETAGHVVAATWVVEEPPVIAEGPAGTFNADYDFFTLLFFTFDARLEVDGEPVQGRPYVRDIWRRSIGGDRSSCVFALAETMTRVAG